MNYPLLAQKMPQRIKKVWQKSIFLTSAIFVLLGIIMFGILRYLHQLSALWGSILIGYFLIVLIVTILKFILVPYRYEFHRYEITPEDLVFQKGLFFAQRPMSQSIESNMSKRSKDLSYANKT